MPCPPLSDCPRFALFVAALLALVGCATPVFKDDPAAAPSPTDIAAAPDRYHDAAVIWGGKILDVRNLADTTQVQVVAYPLDRAQRPDTRAPSLGRFVVVLPGYVESMDYPPGRWLSVRGHIVGSEVHRIDEHDVAHPLVRSDEVHLWPMSFPYERGHFTFGFGVGVGVR
jgi:outer membrane lipoprotein